LGGAPKYCVVTIAFGKRGEKRGETDGNQPRTEKKKKRSCLSESRPGRKGERVMTSLAQRKEKNWVPARGGRERERETDLPSTLMRVALST